MLWGASAVAPSWDTNSVRPVGFPWPSLDRVVRPRGGQVVVVLAAPGIGKTMWAMNWAAQSQALTLYVSADTDSKIMTAQVASLATGHLKEKVEERLITSPQWRRMYADAVRRTFPNLVFDFSSSPRIEDVSSQAEALTEVWGEPPALVVLDTARNVRRDNDGFDGWEKFWIQTNDFARYFNCVVLLPHHLTRGPASNGTLPPELSDGMYRCEDFAEIVLGLYRTTGGEISVMAVKNRGGRPRVPVPLKAQYEYARLTEKPRGEDTPGVGGDQRPGVGVAVPA